MSLALIMKTLLANPGENWMKSKAVRAASVSMQYILKSIYMMEEEIWSVLFTHW